MAEKENKPRENTANRLNESLRNRGAAGGAEYRGDIISAVKENCRIGENFEKYGNILQAIENYEYALFLLECLQASHLKLKQRGEHGLESCKIEKNELKVIDKSDQKHKKLLEEIKEEYALRIEIRKKVNILTEQLQP
ncbi:hypothetical protein M1141_01635 [Candidatus Marsarchaeota archaeon]|nr:hypothetical protein [Candidatus Marsarchaeota archaeon]